MRRLIQWLLLMPALLALACIGTARAADATPSPPNPVQDFFAAPAMSRPVLSPSGRHLAVQVPGPEGRRRLAVLALDNLKDLRVVAAFFDADVDEVQWVNDERLVFTVTDLNAAWSEQAAPGLFAVDRDGRDQRSLVKRDWAFITNTSSSIVSRELPPNHQLLRVLRDGSADVALLRTDFVRRSGELIGTTALRLDTRTGRSTSLATGTPAAARDWLLDEQGQPQIITSLADGRQRVHVRAAQGDGWAEVAQFPAYLPSAGGYAPYAIGLDGQAYAVAASGRADGTSALFALDRRTGQLAAKPMVSVQGFDFAGSLLFDQKTRQLIGVRYIGDAADTQWLDPDLQALQKRIDARLRGTINRLDLAECGCSRWVLVSSFSDRQPPIYTLYDRETDRLQPIAAARPRIESRRMASRDFQRISARDGLEFPLHITRPAGPGPWPTVVLVHGGPFLRGGHWRWDAESQFLASRGYLVLEPEFRGSAGYGQRLFRAGFKQWGLKMQDDMADAARWAIAQGLADPQRVCIAGGSYGGYATLMGLINDPALYRCGVAMAAVTDIGLLYSLAGSDLSDVWRQHGLPALVGSPKDDATQLQATSPLQQAARLKQPLLLVHGTLDRRVPIEHFMRLRDALQAAHAPVESVVYGDEGHGFIKPETRFELWTRIERFLAQHLAAPDRR